MMQLFTPHVLTPTASPQLAVAALTRLGELHTALSAELKSLPTPRPALSDGRYNGDKQALESQTSALLQQIESYWQAPSSKGISRRNLFIDGMAQALRDELTVKIHEHTLDKRYLACVPTSGQTDPTLEVFSLHVQLNDDILSEINGALVFINAQGFVLLVVPGIGAEGFATRTALGEALIQWLNNDALRHALLNNAERYDQLTLEAITHDPQLYLEPFTPADLQLQPVSGKPFEHAFERQCHKQRSDVLSACLDAPATDTQTYAIGLEAAIRMQGLFGPGAMLEQREMAYWERQQRKHLPDGIKIASQEDLNQYQQHLTEYEQSRTQLLSALGGAASHDQFARIRLRSRLGSDLGYDLEPGEVMVATQRQLPITGEPYTVSHSLLNLALYGLHPDDRKTGSTFLAMSTLSLDGAPMQARYPLLTSRYVANLVDELNLNITFGNYQRTAYAAGSTQELMRELTRKQITALAWAAKMQGHIQPADLQFIKQIEGDTRDQASLNLHVQQIRLDGSDTLGNMLIFRKNDAQGHIDRLVMFAADVPRAQQFKAFDNLTQLLHELVSWVGSPELSKYLLEQLPVASRASLEKRFSELRLKPHPSANYVQLMTRDNYDQALGELVRQHIQVAATNQMQRTPGWYLRASHAQRQELLALEEALVGATRNYQAKPHTQAQAFEAYVHQRASKKISELLSVTEGSVDPDHIIITTEREVLSYTQMLRNGYDDSLGLIRSTADTHATFSGPEHVDLTPLTPQRVARSVQGKWLSDDYIHSIRETLLNPASQGYEYRRQSSLQMTVLHMQAAALRSYLKGQLDTRQYQWLRLSMSKLHLSDSQTRHHYPIHNLQLRLENALIATNVAPLGEVAKDIYTQLLPIPIDLTQIETVQGCYLLSPPEAGQMSMLYTPQAPDGIEFRLLSSFKGSLAHPGMIDYYKDRCRIDARRKLSFFLRDMAQGGASKPPVMPKDPISDFHDICFSRPLERQLRDIEDTTTGRSDMLAKLAWTTVELIATVATLPFPPASFAVGALLSLRDSMRALHAFADGDQETASSYILSSLFNSLGAAGDLSAGFKGFGALRHLRQRGQHASALPLVKSIAHPPYHAGLLPAELDGEIVWLSKPNANGYAPVNRSNVDPNKAPQPTGQLAKRNAAGTWQPLNHLNLPSGVATDVTASGLSVNISLRDAVALSPAHGQGVRVLNGKHYIELQAQVFEVQFDARTRHWNIIDPHNPFSFFGKRPVKLNDQGTWKLLERPHLRGGMDDSFKPLQSPLPEASASTRAVNKYELPQRLRVHFGAITQTGEPLDALNIGLDDYFASFYKDMRAIFNTQREKLYRDAQRFFASATPAPRPRLPVLDANIDVNGLFKKLFEHNNAIVMGEAPKSIASKRLLIDNMALLAEQEVEVLYIQHLLTDAHLEKLEKYRRLGARSKTGSQELRYWLDSLNDGQLNNRSTEYDYYHLIKIAHRHGIEVRPLSSSISYPLFNSPAVTVIEDIAAEQKMSNFFSHLLINDDVAARPSRRWVALLDQELANTHQQVPGMAELQGAISLRVHDVPAGRPTRISQDIEDTHQAFGKADFKIEMANPLIREQSTAGLATSVTPMRPTRLDNALLYQMRDKVKAEIGNPYTGKPGFEWTQSSGWQPVDLQHWPAQGEPTAIQLSLRDSRYDMPADTRHTLHELAMLERWGLDSTYLASNAQQATVEVTFFRLRNTLQRDARAIITRELPPRPPMPAVPSAISHSDFLEDLYQHTDGVIIGEAHSSIASKKIIIDNLPLLVQQNVKTLYMEHLFTDLHQFDLDHFFDTGYMSKALLHDLKRLDTGHYTDINGLYTYEQLVLKARVHGLEVRAIDCTASYNLKGIADRAPTTRQQMFSYFASRTVRKHQEVMGAHKWIALVGNTHANTFEKIIPGLAELEGGIGVRVIDVLPGKGRGTLIDQGELLVDSMRHEQSFIKSDFRVEMETLRPAIAPRPLQPLTAEQRLTRPGMFLLEDDGNGGHTIVHRSKDKALHSTPVQVNTEGKLYVERVRWPLINLKPFDDIPALIVGLQTMNLKRVI